jgi:hypothetical protein
MQTIVCTVIGRTREIRLNCKRLAFFLLRIEATPFMVITSLSDWDRNLPFLQGKTVVPAEPDRQEEIQCKKLLVDLAAGNALKS